MGLAAVRGIEIGQAGNVVVGIPVIEAIGDDLVDALVPPKAGVGHRGKIRVAGEENAIDIQPGVAHPEVEGVGPGGRNGDADRGGRARRGVRPSPGVVLLKIDLGSRGTDAVQTDIQSGGGGISRISPHPDIVCPGIGKSDAVIDLGTGGLPGRRNRRDCIGIRGNSLDVARSGIPRCDRVVGPRVGDAADRPQDPVGGGLRLNSHHPIGLAKLTQARGCPKNAQKPYGQNTTAENHINIVASIF